MPQINYERLCIVQVTGYIPDNINGMDFTSPERHQRTILEL